MRTTIKISEDTYLTFEKNQYFSLKENKPISDVRISLSRIFENGGNEMVYCDIDDGIREDIKNILDKTCE